MTFTAENLSLRDREYHKFSDAVGTGSETPIAVVLASGNIFIGSVSASVDSIYVQSGDNINITSVADIASSYLTSGNAAVTQDTSPWVIGGSDAISAAVSVNPVYVGGKAESTVPTEVSDGDAVDYWVDTFGRLINKSTNLSQNSMDVSEIAPAMLQSINTVNLSAVGSLTGSNVGAWVNVSDFNTKSIYYEFTSGLTGSMATIWEASPDAGSTAYTVGSYYYFETSENRYDTNTEHHEYMRLRTAFNEGGTLTATITGRGGA